MKLIVDKLACARGGRTLLFGLSCTVESGEALLVTGPNGAGKTTLIRTIAGLLEAAAGQIWLDGGDPEQSLSEQCHYVGHLDALKSSLTVEENALFWSRYLGGVGTRVIDALERFGLAPLRTIPVSHLSAGQKRRLGLTRLVLAERPVWLLDEPAASLDDASQELLIRTIDAHLAAGGLVVAATHQPLDVVRFRQLPLGGAALAA